MNALALTIVLSTTIANALPSVRLEYERGVGAEKCPERSEMETRVAARLGQNPFVVDGKTIARVQMSGDGNEAHAVVEMIDEQGNSIGVRELKGKRKDCSDLASATVLALSLALDELAKMPVVEKPPPVVDEKPAPEKEKPKAVEEKKVVPFQPGPRIVLMKKQARRWWGVQGHGGGSAQLGGAPGIAPGVFAGVMLRVLQFSMGIDIAMVTPSFAAKNGTNLTGALALTKMTGCVHAMWIGGCALVEAGGLGLFSLPAVQQRVTPWLAAGGRLVMDVPIGSIFVARLLADVTAPFLWTRVVVDGKTLWRTAPLHVGGGMALGVAW